jgi:hypothetical protein
MEFYKVIRLVDGQAVTGYSDLHVSFLPNREAVAMCEEEAQELIRHLKKRFPHIFKDNLSYEQLPILQH